MTNFDVTLQAQVDAQLMEQGGFAPLDLLFDSGRLMYSDYEAWRRGEIDVLDDVLMGNQDKIRGELEQAVCYARAIGLTEQTQEFHAWDTDKVGHGNKPLRISHDAQLNRLIASRYVPAQKAPQMDLFFDNPVVALTNGLVEALSARKLTDAQRLLDRLYTQAPNHADLPGFDQLLAALSHLGHTVVDPAQETDFLLEITPAARRLLGSQSRDLLSPLWRQVAQALAGQAFSTEHPMLHASFASSQSQDWAAVADSVLAEPQWWLQAALCTRLVESAFHRRRRNEGLTAWCQLCWHAPEQLTEALSKLRQTEINTLWRRFLDCEDDCELAATDFPAWLLLHEPGLAQHLPLDLPAGTTPGEEHYRYVHRWLQARRANRPEEEMSLRKALQANNPALFRVLKQSLRAAPAGG
jgi:hypothetical protein